MSEKGRIPLHAQELMSAAGVFEDEVTPEAIETELQDIDQEQILEEERALYVAEVWDKRSPVNGAPADQVLASLTDIPYQEIVLLRDLDTGRVVLFQPFQPGAAGYQPIATAEANSVVTGMREDVVQVEAAKRIARIVAERLSAKP